MTRYILHDKPIVSRCGNCRKLILSSTASYTFACGVVHYAPDCCHFNETILEIDEDDLREAIRELQEAQKASQG